jgi:hypothetical protein
MPAVEHRSAPQGGAAVAEARQRAVAVTVEVRANGGRFSTTLPDRFAPWAVREMADAVAECLGVDREEALAAIATAYAEVAR